MRKRAKRGSRRVGKEGKVRGREQRKGSEGQTPPEQNFWLRPCFPSFFLGLGGGATLTGIRHLVKIHKVHEFS